jgi:hypothetical protein
MGFTTYENRNSRHVTIHCDACGQLRKRGGVHRYGQGKYEEHVTYAKAKLYAESTSLLARNCSFCNPQDG